MRLNDVLLEKQNYETIFTEIMNIVNEYGTEDMKKWYSKEIPETIKEVKSSLKKMDRIQWMLKYTRIVYLNGLTRYEVIPEEVRQEIIEKRDKYLSQMGMTRQDLQRNSPQTVLYKLQHFLSLSRVHKIQNYQFKNQPWSEIKKTFEEYESEWQDSLKENGVKIQDGDRAILTFDGGKKAWWLLDRGSCDDEAKAMGHCGNVPSEKQFDQILSFRTASEDPEYWVPHLTFILNKGVLGEMKGRANNKPDKKYHPYIIALLKQKYVEEIRGGGYAADQNFSLGDLPENVREELLAEKPSLGSLYDLYTIYGMTPEIERRIYDELDRQYKDEPYSIDAKTTILKQWDSLEEFMNEITHIHKDFDALYQFLRDRSDDVDIADAVESMNSTDVDSEIYYRIVEKLTETSIQKLAKRLGVSPNFNTYSGTMNFVDSIYGNADVKYMFDSAIVKSLKNEIKNMSDDDIVKVGKIIITMVSRELRIGDVGIYYDETPNELTNIRVEIYTKTLIEYLSTDQDGDGDGDYYEADEFRQTKDYFDQIETYQINDTIKSNSDGVLDEDEYADYKRIMSKIRTKSYDIDLSSIEKMDFEDMAIQMERELNLMDSYDMSDLKSLAGIA